VFSPTESSETCYHTPDALWIIFLDDRRSGSCYHTPNFVLLHTGLRVITHRRRVRMVTFLPYVRYLSTARFDVTLLFNLTNTSATLCISDRLASRRSSKNKTGRNYETTSAASPRQQTTATRPRTYEETLQSRDHRADGMNSPGYGVRRCAAKVYRPGPYRLTLRVTAAPSFTMPPSQVPCRPWVRKSGSAEKGLTEL
jgi:hypothetical protein